MAFPPPPGAHFLPNLTAITSLVNMPSQYQMTPMGGLIPMTVGIPPPQIQSTLNNAMGITVPTGVATISAPPVRKVTPEVPQSLLGMPSLMPQLNLQNVNIDLQNNQNKKTPTGPTITVFVGNITERASDMLIRQLLSKCGTVNNWKRVQGANGKLQGFGFCEYSDAESAMRAIRLLHEFEIADKKLVVKVDPKAKEKLDEYVKENNPNATSSDNIDSLDEETKKEDENVLTQLESILKEHEIELSRDPDPNHRNRRIDKRTGEPGKPENLADMEMEEEKRSLIHREIYKFRDTYKVQDEEKERAKESNEGKKDENTNGKLIQTNSSSSHGNKSSDRHRDKKSNNESRSNSDRGNRSNRERDRSPVQKERSSRRERDREYRERDRFDRGERNSNNNNNNSNNNNLNSFSTLGSIERNDERGGGGSYRDSERLDIDDEEETYERRRLERKMREKEASYQERLRNWEAREARKRKEYEKDLFKQETKSDEENKEMKRLKQFLEDYDDDRDDSKYYKSTAFLRRLRERQKEKEDDERDRRQEKRELEELRRKLVDEGHPDPEAEAKKRLNSTENERERNKIVNAKIKELMSEARSKVITSKRNGEDENSLLSEGTPNEELHVKSFSFNMSTRVSTNITTAAGTVNAATATTTVAATSFAGTINPVSQSPIDATIKSSSSSTTTATEKRKKFSVQDVFNANDDDDLANGKKRKLPSLIDDNTDSNQSVLSNSNSRVNLGGNDSVKSLSSEEKRKQIKSLIEKIPTSKEELFQYSIDWSLVDNTLMERRIRPWINKKITEYIGEEEQVLLDFICKKLQAKSSAQSILDDVAMVLDEEAEVFVVKMWRLLIYEIEAKKLGLGK